MTPAEFLAQQNPADLVGHGCLIRATNITKARCVYNQEAKQEGSVHINGAWTPKDEPAYYVCQDCERGREVKAEMKGKAKLEPKRRDRGQCIEPGCTEKVYSKRLCRKHYQNRRNQRLRGKAQALAMVQRHVTFGKSRTNNQSTT